MQFNVMVPLLFISAVLCFAILIFLVRKLRVVTSGPVSIIIMMILWAACGGVENLVVSAEAKMLAVNVAYIAYAYLTPLWLMFVLSYVKRSPQWKNPYIIGLFAVFTIFILCNWFNPGNLFYISSGVEEINGQFHFSAEYGPLFWIYTVCSYSLLLVMMLFIILYHKRGRLSRRNVTVIVVAVLLPIILNALYTLGAMPWDGTALCFPISGFSMILLYKGEFFTALPLSHKTVIDEMVTGYVLLGSDRSVVEMNDAAKHMLTARGGHEEEDAQRIIFDRWRLDPSIGSDSTVEQLAGTDGIARYFRVSINKISSGSSSYYYALLLSDETALFNAKERMHYLERYDESTELYNRPYFLELLEKEIEKCKSGVEQTVVLVCISIMNYNDCCCLYGNDFGNIMIHSISRAIKDIVRSDDAISRFSLDEIYLFMKFDSMTGLAERVNITMERIFNRFASPVEVNGIKFEAKLKIGVAFAPQHADNAGALINMAGMAKRSISRFFKYRYSIYHENTGDSYNRVTILERDLHSAIENDEMYLMFQPQVDTREGKVIGAEALVRWTHPELGLIPPVDFIPIAEDNGLITKLGEWVLRETVMQLKRWQDIGITDLRVSANVSLNQLADELFADKVINIVDEAGVDASLLELEITESLALFPEAMTHGHLQKLRSRGVRIAMDDFGMGHSSLAYIKQFELDTIKIDRALSSDIMTNSTSVAMIRSVRMLCDTLGLDTIVEYVETPEQVERLKDLECFIVQGYVYSPPLPEPACTKYILRSRQKAKTGKA